jgi:hypothetical protein
MLCQIEMSGLTCVAEQVQVPGGVPPAQSWVIGGRETLSLLLVAGLMHSLPHSSGQRSGGSGGGGGDGKPRPDGGRGLPTQLPEHGLARGQATSEALYRDMI